MTASTALDVLLNGRSLPSPRWQRRKLRWLLQRQAPFDELAEQIRCEPAITGRIIGLANDALAPGQSADAAVNAETLAAIELPSLRQLFAEPALPPALCAGFDYQCYWSRALAMACAARLAGDALRLGSADELFTCGLLATIGELALATLRPLASAQALSGHADAAQALLPNEEARRFIPYRLVLSAGMMRSWGMPVLLCNAVACHGSPSGQGQTGSEASLGRLLQLASAVADLVLLNGAGKRDAALGAARALGMDAADLDTLLRHSQADWIEWQDLPAAGMADRGAAPCAGGSRLPGSFFSEFV
ncbi:HDOD domain-containing protein [Janthinobacterium sp.]|uniref:HDOD domain-containing protein n=1 Tax=Janthinobacterium sp. TaxID=1871054 RepID=UPI00262F9632|nr:HDOD domain-containing protein [Janthinobacterium sp.]